MTCTHCTRDMYTTRGYLVLVSPPGTLPVVYACHPSCEGFPRVQGSLWDTLQPVPPPPVPEVPHAV
jgi:hypothetical protein